MTTMNYKKISWGGSLTASMLVIANAAAADTAIDQTRLDEIVVTAQKRSESLQDVPVPVTALSAETLVNNNELRLQDYYTSVPGFVVSPSSVQGTQILAIRGLTTGEGNPTVGITIDDIPYGSGSLLGGLGVPDLDPGDLSRIEVLRGPQGTIYGANSLGGLVNFITADPSPDAFSGRVQAGMTSVKNGDGLGYNVRGSVNVPLGDTLALRASAFTREESGYIDNTARGIDGINELSASGGRLSLLWKPSDTLKLKLNAMYQKTEADSVPVTFTSVGFGDLEQGYVVDTSSYKEVQNYSAILTANLGAATLTSLTGYNIATFDARNDSTASLGGLMQIFYGVPGGMQTTDARTKKFSQELRVSMPLGEKFEALVGGYYTKEDTLFGVNFFPVDLTTQQIVDTFLLADIPSDGTEVAAFANLTYQVTDRFDVQFGGRQTQFKGEGSETDHGVIYNALFGRPDPYNFAVADVDLKAFTYLVTPRFKVTPDVMVYARFASGYRPGGGNVSVAPSIPREFDPDETRNYELGVKADFLDRTLTLDVSAYYIDWKDIQLFLDEPVTDQGYLANGGTAKSQGLEIAIQSRPLTGLTIGGWVAWNTAELTEDLPARSTVAGSDGDRLPYNMKFSGKLGVQQSFPLMSGMDGFVGADVSYVGERLAAFVPAGARPVLPAYTQTNVRAGLNYDSWTANLFVSNLTDKRGMLSRGDSAADYSAVLYTQPRTFGLSLAKTF